jgi:hypothetical protein
MGPCRFYLELRLTSRQQTTPIGNEARVIDPGAGAPSLVEQGC